MTEKRSADTLKKVREAARRSGNVGKKTITAIKTRHAIEKTNARTKKEKKRKH